MIFALGAISTMSFGLAGELGQSVIPVGWQLSNTMAAWQDTHYALIGAAVFGGFAALYYWFPKFTGRTMGESLGRTSFFALLIGVHLMCIPMFLAGLEGQPVDIFKYYQDTGLSFYNLLASIGSFVLAIGVVLSVVNAAASVRGGARAGHDPWLGSTLEWFALSPPPEHNFDAVPDVRSVEPMRDIREAIRRQTEAFRPPPRPDPVASRVSAPGEPEDASGDEEATGGNGDEGGNAPVS
jgi:cytochrome c oxidase subunit 1